MFALLLGTMSQNLHKYIKDFDEDMAKFRENPGANDDEEAEKAADPDAEDESKDEDSSAPVTKSSEFKKKSLRPRAPPVKKSKVVKKVWKSWASLKIEI